MSEYTLVSFTSSVAKELERDIEFAINSRNTTTRNNVTANRLGGDKVEDVIETLIGDKNGELLWEAPIYVDVESGEVLGYLVIDLYEDTGDSHQTRLFEVRAFEEAELLDERVGEDRIYDDRTGEDVEAYYQEEFDLNTIIKVYP